MTNADLIHTLRTTLWVIKYSIELVCIPLEDLEKSQEPRYEEHSTKKAQEWGYPPLGHATDNPNPTCMILRL